MPARSAKHQCAVAPLGRVETEDTCAVSLPEPRAVAPVGSPSRLGPRGLTANAPQSTFETFHFGVHIGVFVEGPNPHVLAPSFTGDLLPALIASARSNDRRASASDEARAAQ